MHRCLVLCALGAVALLTAAPSALRGGAEAAGRRQASPADEETTRRVCVNCHGEGHLSARRSRDQWGEVLDRMSTMGADMNDEEVAPE